MVWLAYSRDHLFVNVENQMKNLEVEDQQS